MNRKLERRQAGNEVEKGGIQMWRGKVTILRSRMQKPWRIMIESANIGVGKGKMVETSEGMRWGTRRRQGVKEGGTGTVGVKEGGPVCKVWGVQGTGCGRGCLQ